jgi:mono/diheme cytochrome c family protein
MRPMLAAFLALPALWLPTLQSVVPPDRGATAVEHGRYIVERVSMCFECHTPRNENGDLLRSDWLLGAPIPVSPPPFAAEGWAIRAPRIAGMPGYTEEQGVRLLTRGIDRTGKTLRPPMPPFRFSEADARAIVAYLKSLGPESGR